MDLFKQGGLTIKNKYFSEINHVTLVLNETLPFKIFIKKYFTSFNQNATPLMTYEDEVYFDIFLEARILLYLGV